MNTHIRVLLVVTFFLTTLSLFVSSFPTSHTSFATDDKKVKPTPTPTGFPVCLAEITYAKNPKNGNCKSFSSSCEVPKNWKVVDECPTKPVKK